MSGGRNVQTATRATSTRAMHSAQSMRTRVVLLSIRRFYVPGRWPDARLGVSAYARVAGDACVASDAGRYGSAGPALAV